MAFKKAKKPVKAKKIVQRLVAERNIERYKTLGYKLVKKDVLDKQGKVLGIRPTTQELVLMEKEI